MEIVMRTKAQSTEGRQRRPNAPRLLRIGKIQHGVDRIRRMSRARRPYPTRALRERPPKPRRKGAAGPGPESQAFPWNPCQRAPYSLNAPLKT
jgi:hypothetical protein